MRVEDSACRKFCNSSYHQHYGTFLEQKTSDIIFTVITSAFIVGGMLGAMLGGLLADKLGRKKGLILSQLMGVLGGLTMALSRPTMAWEVLLVGRLVVGLTAGLNTVLVPVYVSEISPLHLRGALGGLQHFR